MELGTLQRHILRDIVSPEELLVWITLPVYTCTLLIWYGGGKLRRSDEVVCPRETLVERGS